MSVKERLTRTIGSDLVSNANDVTAEAVPTVSADAGGVIRAGSNVTIQSLSTTDADASSKSASGGAVAVTTLASELSVNIADIEIAHSSEGNAGVLILLVTLYVSDALRIAAFPTILLLVVAAFVLAASVPIGVAEVNP